MVQEIDLVQTLDGETSANARRGALVRNQSLEKSSSYARVGYVPENENMYDWMTAHEFVSTFARLHGLTEMKQKKELSALWSSLG